MNKFLLIVISTLLLSACNQSTANLDTTTNLTPGAVAGETTNNTQQPDSDSQSNDSADEDTPEPETPSDEDSTETSDDSNTDDSQNETQVSENDDACTVPTITYFDTVEKGMEILDNFCGSWGEYAAGIRHVHSGMDWDVKALYGVIAATSAYYGIDVDMSVVIQNQAPAEYFWHDDLSLPLRIREERATEEERFIVANLLLFNYAMESNGYNTNVTPHFPLWQLVKYGEDNSLSSALLILYEFIRGGNIYEMEFRIQRDPQLKETLDPFNRVF